MKILHAVESYYPSISGAPEVVRHLSERMVKAGHDVTVATRKLPNRTNLVHNGVKIVEFDIIPTSNRGMSTVTGLAGETKKYQNYLIKGDFDIIMTYAAQQWTTDLMLPILDKIKAKKVIVPCGYSGLFDPEYKYYFKELPNYLRKFDASIYLAEDYRDINFAKKNNLKNVLIIPNGADENEFKNVLTNEQKKKIRKEYGIKGPLIITIANYTGEKGHYELIRLFKHLPLPQVTLVSAGNITPGIGSYDFFKEQADIINSSKKFIGKKIIMVDGSKRQEVLKLLKCADLFIFLSNIEASPLVLFEASAAGVPFIATSAGNSAEIAKWTGGGIVVKTLDKENGRVRAHLKDALLKTTYLLYNTPLRRSIGRRSRHNWKQKYTWKKITNEFLELYQSLIEARK